MGIEAGARLWLTLKEVGQRFSVTRERIRQIEAESKTNVGWLCQPRD